MDTHAFTVPMTMDGLALRGFRLANNSPAWKPNPSIGVRYGADSPDRQRGISRFTPAKARVCAPLT